MAASDLIPKSEPAQLRAGLTWQWRREDLPDYPAGTWTLKYQFRGSSAGFNFDATADASHFAVTVAKATTAAYAAGTYTGTGYVTDGSTDIEVWRGTLTVLPSLSAGDARGHIRKVLDAIEAVIEGRASKSDLEYEISVNGSMRRLRRIPHADLIVLRETYKRYEAQEIASDRVSSGRPSGRKIVTRFVRPS
jgi:hypothetical protein